MRLIAALLLFFCLTVDAAAATLRFGQRGETLPVFKVTTFYSQEGETLDAFALRMGVWFRNFTTTSGYEACGLIFASSTEEGKWALPIFTNNSQIGCAMPETTLEGYALTKETIHSHPVEKMVEPNANDRIFLQGQSDRFHVERRQRRNVDPRTFSNTDFAGGPGYLVTDGKVLYQAGPKSVREVGVLPAP